jgi:hypothetical protein
MKNFKQICFGAVTMAVMATGTTLIANSAQALTLDGGFVMTGTVNTLPGANPILKFKDFTIGSKTGDFAGLSGTPVIADLALTDPGVLNNAVDNKGVYVNPAIANFISGLDLGGGLTFDLDASNVNLFGFIANASDFAIAGPVTGFFKQGGTVVGKGFLGVNNDDGISAISLTTKKEAIPTPALLPGLLGLGAAAWRKRKSEQAAVVA